jgi:hypothetical protein
MFATIEPPLRPRAEIRAQLRHLGTPAAHIVDVACQAADQAFRAAMRTTDLLADDRERMTAIGIVWSLVASYAERTIEGLREFAAMAGLKAEQFSTAGQS